MSRDRPARPDPPNKDRVLEDTAKRVRRVKTLTRAETYFNPGTHQTLFEGKISFI